MTSPYEADIQRIGRAIFDHMERESPSIFRRDFWQGKIMDWSMRDEAFKIEMFRFVDVFPVLNSPEAIARHVQEYFCRDDQDFPAWIQLGLKSVAPNSLVGRTAAGQIEKNVRSMAKTFVAGTDGADAMKNLTKMRRAGLAFTVDLLGEATVSEAEAEHYQRTYRALIRDLADQTATFAEDPRLDTDALGPIPRANVSVKISSLYSQADPVDFNGSVTAIRDRLVPLCREARERGVFLNLDMEHYEVKDLTFAVYRSLYDDPALADWRDLGCVLQAYLRDSLDDARDLVAWAREHDRYINVRLVKGAYWDYETIHAQQHGWSIPVFQNKWESDANYEACLEVLMGGYPHVRVAIASHNVRSIAAGMAIADRMGVPKNGLEIQMLYGMAEPMKKAMAKLGYRTRDYVPVGELVPGMAYLVRRLLENTSNEGFLKAKFVDQADADVLLAPPTDRTRRPDPVPDSPFLNEAHTDFARADERAQFAEALAWVRTQLGARYPAVVGDTAWATEQMLTSTNPARADEVIGITACTTTQHADEAVRDSYRAFAAWRQRPVGERAALLRALAAEMRRRRHELSAWMVLEVGKCWREADADTAEAIDFCEYYATRAEEMMAAPHRLGRYPGELNQLMYQPMGVGAVIAPWNFPLAILTGMTMGAVATGNCVVMKPAEQSPVIAAKLFEMIQTVGFPPGVVQFLPGVGEEVGAHLVAHPHVRFVAFTGSRDVGLHILRTAYDTQPTFPGPKRVVCEMGGKNAIIVDNDADLDEAVAAVIHSAFGFQGQKCSACSRVILVEGNHEAFIERLVEATRSLEVGPPEDPAYGFGPVVDAEAAAKVRHYIAIGREEGTPLIVHDPDRRDGHFVPFAIFDHIEPHHRLATEEVFGPVVAVMRARDFGHALEIANGTSYALTGGVVSRSPVNLERARAEFRVGNLYINRGCTGALVYRQPFGGFKYSGIGTKAGGPNYLHQFVEERAISENTMRRGFAPDA